jgi:hypothetical protein
MPEMSLKRWGGGEEAMMMKSKFLKNIYCDWKFLIPFGPWCVGDDEVVVVVPRVVPIWKKLAKFCLTISLSLGRLVGQQVTISLSHQGLNCTATAASDEKNEGTTFPGLNCSTKMFWYTQRFRSKCAPETIFVCGNCCLFRCLLLSASVHGGRQTNHPPFLFYFADKD